MPRSWHSHFPINGVNCPMNGVLAAVILCLLWLPPMANCRAAQSNEKKPMQLTSSAFKEGEAIPAKYTCDDKNLSPPLKWSGVPVDAKSLTLIADDPDAPAGTWTHWLLFNLPTSAT